MLFEKGKKLKKFAKTHEFKEEIKAFEEMKEIDFGDDVTSEAQIVAEIEKLGTSMY